MAAKAPRRTTRASYPGHDGPTVVVECHVGADSEQQQHHIVALKDRAQQVRQLAIQREKENCKVLNKFHKDTKARLESWRGLHQQNSSAPQQHTTAKFKGPDVDGRLRESAIGTKCNAAAKGNNKRESGISGARVRLLRHTKSRDYARFIVNQAASETPVKVSNKTWLAGGSTRVHQQDSDRLRKVRESEMAVERMQIKLMKEHQKVTEDRQVELDKLVRARKLLQKEKVDTQYEAEQEVLRASQHKIEEQKQRILKKQRTKDELVRYITALEQRLYYKLQTMKLDIPQLCTCSLVTDSSTYGIGALGPTWERCANNCVYRNNPHAYAKALRGIYKSLEV